MLLGSDGGDGRGLVTRVEAVPPAFRFGVVSKVGSREERIARNEATAREINEQIEQSHAGAPMGEQVRILCECGWLECDRVIAITISEYETVRADPRQFAVVSDHVMPDIEDVVAQTDRYAVVAKREGTPAAVAIQEDPRA
jgi:hypothetical protein